MPTFDVSKEWVIFLQPDAVHAKKAAEDLSRYIGLLAGLGKNNPQKPPVITEKHNLKPAGAIIALKSENNSPELNGFTWNAGTEQVEIRGESDRGLCNGIYSFLAALGISWPAPGQENLPSRGTDLSSSPSPETDLSQNFPLTADEAHKPSTPEGNGSAAALRRFVPAGNKTLKTILKNCEAFAAWAARKRYDSIIIPLAAFRSGTARLKLKQLSQFAGEYGISLEAGGRDLSLLVPRKYFLLHRDCFRMVVGKREKAHHFCPTNPGTLGIIKKEGLKIFQAAEGIKVFHLWPDKGAESTWCSCPTCRAFTPSEQNRIAVNAATDTLSSFNPGASVTFFEKAGEGGSIPLRRNLSKIEILPDEKEFFD